MQLMEIPSVSAAGQVDDRGRKHKYPGIQQADEDLRGELLGENHCI